MMNASKLVLIVCSIIGAVLFAGCGRNAGPSTEQEILCTTYPIWLMTNDLASGAKHLPAIRLLVPANTGCPHDYALSPNELLQFSGVRKLYVFWNGGGLDSHIMKSIRSVKPDLQSFNLTGVDQSDTKTDPHCFSAPGTCRRMVEKLVAALKEADPEDSAIFERNAEVYYKTLEGLSERCRKSGATGEVLLMHDTCAGLVREFGLSVAGTVLEDEAEELTPLGIQKNINILKGSKKKVLITEPQTPENIAKLLQAETGVQVIRLDPAISGSMDVSGCWFLENLKANVEKLESVYSGEESEKK